MLTAPMTALDKGQLTVLLGPADRRALRDAREWRTPALTTSGEAELPWLVFDVVLSKGGAPATLAGEPYEGNDPASLAERLVRHPVLLWDQERLAAINAVLTSRDTVAVSRCVFLCDWARGCEFDIACADLFALGYFGSASLDLPTNGAGQVDHVVGWTIAIISALYATEQRRGPRGRPTHRSLGDDAEGRPSREDDPATVRRTRRLRLLDHIGEGGDTEAFDAIRTRVAPLLTPLPLLGDMDPQRLQDELDAGFPWLTTLNRLAADALRSMKGYGCDWFHTPPLLLVGPPGVGKTAWAQGLAERLGLPMATLAVGGTSDSRALEGTARGWSNCIPGLPVLVAADHMVCNPVILIDELDKAGGSGWNGDVRGVLLGLLEPDTARRHWDACLHGHLDLSWVSWLLTANRVAPIPSPLLSRCHVVEVGGPSPDHLPAIVEGVRARISRRYGVPLGDVPHLSELHMARLTSAFRRHGSVRRVRQDIEATLGRLAWAQHRGTTRMRNCAGSAP